MSKTLLYLFLWSCSFLVGMTPAFGQHDSVAFVCDGKRPQQEKIPLNDYPVKMKIEGEKTHRVKITECAGDSVKIRIQSSKKERQAIEEKYGTEAVFAIRNGHYTPHQQDSISRRADSLKKAAQYERTATVAVGTILYIKIPNRQRPEMKKRVALIDLLGFASALMIIGSPYTESPAVYVAVAAFSVGVGIASLTTEYKKIKFSEGWRIQ